tara:strand:+ start:492 stop:2177 length:1686 start_codon:yes stop_codon:yes gene_type:complete
MLKKIKIFFILLLLYQNPVYSKSNNFSNFNSKDFSKYFSGIISYNNNNNPKALEFFESSKILLKKHEPFLEKYVSSLILENKVQKAINLVKKNRANQNLIFFDSYLLLIIDNLKNGKLEESLNLVSEALSKEKGDRLNLAILETLKQYILVFKEKRLLKEKKDFGQLSFISETFQRCYLNNDKTESFFLNLINNETLNLSRYTYFYLSFLVEKKRIDEVKKITNEIEFINSPLLLSQGKDWIDKGEFYKFNEIFSCKNRNDLIGEFLFLISNLYSSQDDFEKSNYYINLSNFSNPKFTFNLSLIAENYYLDENYPQTKKILKKFSKNENFYYWYRLKKEAQIIAKQKNNEQSLKYLVNKFKEIKKPNEKFIFDIANFYKNSKKYNDAINNYTKIIDNYEISSLIKSDLLYRRGGCFERMGDYIKADKDLLTSLKLNPDDAYVLNYLAYSWLERDYKINEAIEMLETAYEFEKDDPYIIDSIGWAYFLIEDYTKAERLLKRAVELMPDDPIVNDHYGDILWKLNRKIQARYFWINTLQMDGADEEMLDKINFKIINGLKKSL